MFRSSEFECCDTPLPLARFPHPPSLPPQGLIHFFLPAPVARLVMTLPCVVNATNSELDTHVQIAQAQARRLGAGTVRLATIRAPSWRFWAIWGDLWGASGRSWGGARLAYSAAGYYYTSPLLALLGAFWGALGAMRSAGAQRSPGACQKSPGRARIIFSTPPKFQNLGGDRI